MIFSAFGKALGQLGDPRFRRVVLIGIGLAFLMLVAVTAGSAALIEWLVPASVSLPWIGPIGGLDMVAAVFGSVAVMLFLSIFLMVPVAALFSGLFLDGIVDAVERRHYPALPAPQPVPFGDILVDTVNFFGLLVAANVLALFLFPFAGPLIPVVFWAVNGLLLGREYFTMVAMRRLGRQGAKSLRARHAGKVWMAGALMAAPLSIPILNLMIPVLGVATFTHLFHRLNATSSA